MRKIYLLFFSFFCIQSLVAQQIPAGTYTVGASGGGVVTYPTSSFNNFSSLFTAGTGALAVYNVTGPDASADSRIFNVVAGYTEPAPVDGFIITRTASAASQVIVRKQPGGGAKPVITAFTPQPTDGPYNAIIKLVGVDYFTFDGINLQENSSNNADNIRTEFGFALFDSSGNNGAQNNTIQNCRITLTRSYVNTFCIYSTTLASSSGGSKVLNATTGANSNNKYYRDTLETCNFGMAVLGTATSDRFDFGNDIGGSNTDYSNGNVIRNQGAGAGVTSTSTYSGISPNTSVGIVVTNNINVKINYNRIAGASSGANIYGIHLRQSGGYNTAFTTNVLNNQITDTTGSSSTFGLMGILNELGGVTSHTLNINGNKIFNCAATNASYAGGFAGIHSLIAVLSFTADLDTVQNNNISGTNLQVFTAPTGVSGAVKVAGLTTSVAISNCLIKNNKFTNTGTGDFITFNIYSTSFSGTANINNNTVDTLIMQGTPQVTAFYHTPNSASSTGTINIGNNVYKNISVTGANTFSYLRFVHSSSAPGQTLNVTNNSIYNLSINTAIAAVSVAGIYVANTSTVAISGNSIKNINSGCTNIGIQTNGTGSASTYNIFNNTVDSLYSTANTPVQHFGLDIAPSSSTTTANIYKNKVSNISTTTSTLALITGIRYSGAITVNLYNNMVYDLKAPASSNSSSVVVGGLVSGTATNANIYNNTVYITGTSTGANFSTAALVYNGTGTASDIRNNILVNDCVPKGTGYAATIMRSSAGTAGAVPTNFGSNTNNNCLYTQTVTNGVIYVEGFNTAVPGVNAFASSCFDLNAYKTFMSTRESSSFSEIPPFISLAPGSMDVHLNTATASGCWQGGTNAVSGTVTDDIDNTARPPGTLYDVGADEGLAASPGSDKIGPVISFTDLSNVGCSNNISLSGVSIIDAGGIATGANLPRLYFKKGYSFDPSSTIATSNNNLSTGWKYIVATGSGPYNFAIDFSLLPGGFNVGDTIYYFVAAQDVSGNVSATYASINACPPTVQFASPQTATPNTVFKSFVYQASYSGAYNIPANFTTLTGSTGLFQAINKGYVTGNITVTVSADVVEPGTNALNQWTEYNTIGCSVIVSPSFTLTVQSDGAVRTFTGTNISPGITGPLIKINGADRITFNGGIGTQRNLRFRNTHTTADSCAAVFFLNNSAQNISIQNCDIQANGTGDGISGFPVTPVSAGVYIGSTGSNNNIVIDSNDIHNAISGTTGNIRYGIYSAASVNTSLTIRANNLYNINNKAIVYGTTFASGQVITGNSIYYNNAAGTVNSTFTGVELLYTSASGHTIDNNYIGGQSANGGIAGSAWTQSGITIFTGINLTSSAGTQTSLTGNVIRNINFTTITGTAFTGISFTGNVLCEKDTIGHDTNSSLGITINGVSATNASSNYCILASGAATNTTATIRKNVIKYITHNTTSTSFVSRLYGIYTFSYPASSTIKIDTNVISTLSSTTKVAGNNLLSSSSNLSISTVTGILVNSSNGTFTVNNNNISGLGITGTSTTQYPGVVGIANDLACTNTIYNNKIANLTNSIAGTAGNPSGIMGMRFVDGNNTVYNNFISVTNGSNNNACRLVGIYVHYLAPRTTNSYHNTVYVDGNNGLGITAAVLSAGYAIGSSNGTHNVQNNIFYNTRTGGTGTGGLRHYSIVINASSLPTLTSNYNNITAQDPNAVGYYNANDYSFVNWKLAPVSKDLNSTTVTPIFKDSSLTAPDLHLDSATNCNLVDKGTNLGILKDIDEDTRKISVPPNGPDVGADEFNFNPVTKSAIATNPACENLPLSITVSTLAPAALTYAWTVPSTITNPGNVNAYSTTNATTSNAGNYIVTVTDKYGCTSSFDSVVTIGANTWLGNNTSWTDASNWTCSVPTSARSATIPVVVSGKYPVIPNATAAVCKNISIASGAAVTTTGTGSLDIKGNFTNSGTLANWGEIKLSGTTAQTFPGTTGTIAAMSSLTLDNSSGANPAVDINRDLIIREVITPVQGINRLNNAYITLRSVVDSTARIGQAGGSFSYTGTSKFIVERYYAGKRKWRLITAPVVVDDTKTVYNSWQLGGVAPGPSAPVGNGTYVTGNPVADGLDASPLNNPSLKTFNLGTGLFDNVLDTKKRRISDLAAGAPALGDTAGFFIFIRGDRNTVSNPSPFSATAAISSTTLRDTRTVRTGSLSFPCVPVVNKFTLIGNPYASPIDYSTVSTTNLQSKFWTWDPSLNTVGGWVYFDGAGFNAKTPNTSVQTKEIQSSQSFMVQTVATASASLTIAEANKSPTYNQQAFRPQTGNGNNETMLLNLFAFNPDGSAFPVDGVRIQTDNKFSDEIDENDGSKFTNINEMFSIRSHDKLLIVERRTPFKEDDIVAFEFTKTRQKGYRIIIEADNLAIGNITAFLEDSYTKTTTPVSLNAATQYDFSVTADAASAAKDRFSIVFKNNRPLPVTFTEIKAWQKGSSIAVEAEVNNEINIVRYQLERSADGLHFEKLYSIPAQNTGGSKAVYSWLDVQPLAGNNFYRIKTIETTGLSAYSSIVKVAGFNGASGIAVYPNPVQDGIIGLQLNNLPAGTYSIRLVNNLGQMLYQDVIAHAGGSAARQLKPGRILTNGNYHLELIGKNKKIQTVRISVQH